jgi:selenocysteine-specific elongation factor
VIVGTAGHIDHGKTTLVKALTGVDTDRLPEEKKRGISIELGYAFLDAGRGARIGFVDVPGHERLVHTMLAGATGIHYALLLVAADDGPMPQTHEHLAVLSLLGIGRGAVVVTKADRVDAARLAQVREQAAELVAGTPLRGSPVLAVSAASGQGIAELRALLLQAAAGYARPADDGRAFRLAIDRVFSLDGVGTVATGTVHAGAVTVGDELRLVPGERRARVRSVHAQGRAVASAAAGERCALGLAGIDKGDIERGQWLVDPRVALASTRLDARLSLWQGEAAPLRSGATVHVHLGAASTLGSVAVLAVVGEAAEDASDIGRAAGDRSAAADAVRPREEALVQLVLRAPIGAWHGDRIVLRDASATRTLAGGAVLDPRAPTRYRRTPQRLAELAALRQGDAAARLQALLDKAPLGIEGRAFAAAQGLREPLVPAALARTLVQEPWLLGERHAEAARAAVLTALRTYHARSPEELGPDAGRLRRLALPRLPDALYRGVLADLQGAGTVQLRGAFVHLPEHGVRLSASEQRIAQKVAPRLADAGFEGAWARDLARDAGESDPLMRTTLARLAQRGDLHQVVKDLYYPHDTMARLATLARRIAAEHVAAGGAAQVGAAEFRDATGLGRKRAIQILEYLDRIGVTRRVGDVHRMRPDSALFGAAGAGERT